MTVGEGLKNGIGDLKAEVAGLMEGVEALKTEAKAAKKVSGM
jgi:outer membrane murein-binding lipoprotein Lpp